MADPTGGSANQVTPTSGPSVNPSASAPAAAGVQTSSPAPGPTVQALVDTATDRGYWQNASFPAVRFEGNAYDDGTTDDPCFKESFRLPGGRYEHRSGAYDRVAYTLVSVTPSTFGGASGTGALVTVSCVAQAGGGPGVEHIEVFPARQSSTGPRLLRLVTMPGDPTSPPVSIGLLLDVSLRGRADPSRSHYIADPPDTRFRPLGGGVWRVTMDGAYARGGPADYTARAVFKVGRRSATYRGSPAG